MIDSTIVKRKKTKRQTIIYKTLHRKLKIGDKVSHILNTCVQCDFVQGFSNQPTCSYGFLWLKCEWSILITYIHYLHQHLSGWILMAVLPHYLSRPRLASTGVSSLHDEGVRVIIWKDSWTIADNMCGDFNRLCTLMTDVVDSQKIRQSLQKSQFFVPSNLSMCFQLWSKVVDQIVPALPHFCRYSVLATLFSFLIP